MRVHEPLSLFPLIIVCLCDLAPKPKIPAKEEQYVRATPCGDSRVCERGYIAKAEHSH